MNRFLDVITPKFITEDVYLNFDCEVLVDVWTKRDYELRKEQ